MTIKNALMHHYEKSVANIYAFYMITLIWHLNQHKYTVITGAQEQGFAPLSNEKLKRLPSTIHC
jgi:hypothetical protein